MNQYSIVLGNITSLKAGNEFSCEVLIIEESGLLEKQVSYSKD
ncbi:MAG: hypothetical protein ACJAYY_003045 [Paraglaciecola sp.]|jgi:hypothetical protein